MKKSKQVVALFLSAAMSVTLLAGCGGSKSEGTTASTAPKASSTQAAAGAGSASEDPFKDHIELTIAHWGIGEALPTDGTEDAVKDTIFKKLNITIKPMNITWDDYKQKVSVWAASDQLPDAFSYDGFETSTYRDWIKQGIIQALPSDLSAYPNVKKVIDSDGTSYYKYPMGDANAKVYAVPRLKTGSIDDSQWCHSTYDDAGGYKSEY